MAGTYFTDLATLAALPPALSAAINAALAAQVGGVITVPAPLDPTETALNDALARITALEAAAGTAPPPVDLGPLLARLSALEALSHPMPDLSPIGDELKILKRAIRALTRRVKKLESDEGDEDKGRGERKRRQDR